MSRALTLGEVKALTRQLIAAVGGTEAAGITLGITHQRVSQFQNVNHPDVMPLMSVLALEAVAGIPLVTGAAARAIEGENANEVAAAVVSAVSASARTLHLVHDMDADGRRDAGEIRSVHEAARENLEQAQRVFDASSRLQPTGSTSG